MSRGPHAAAARRLGEGSRRRGGCGRRVISFALGGSPLGTGPAERVSWLGYIGIGLLATAYGAALPALVHALSRGYADLSILFALFAAGNTVAYFLANFLVDRASAQRILAFGLLLFVAGGLTLGVARTFSAWVFGTLVAGVAFSLVDVSGARVVGAIHPRSPAAALTRLNIFFGVGAISAPLVVGLSELLGAGPQPVFLAVALLGAVGFAAVLRIAPDRASAASQAAHGETFAQYMRRSPWLWLLALSVFFYVAAEVGFGSWIAAYVRLRAGVPVAVSALFPAAYQIGVTVVRLFVGRSLATWRLHRALALGALLAAAATLLAALAGADPYLALLGTLLAGAGFAPAFPAALAIASVEDPGREGWTYASVFSALALAALVAPWGEGQIFSRLPLLALLLTPASALLTAAVAVVLGRTLEGRGGVRSQAD